MDINNIKDESLKQMEDYLLEQKKKLAYEIYLKSNGTIEGIVIGANGLKISKRQFLTWVCDYINNNFELPDYAIAFENLISLKTADEIIEYLDSVNLPINYLESKLLNYVINYRPDILFLKNNLLIDLRKKLAVYDKYLKNLEIRKPKQENANLRQAINTIIKFIESNYTVERFCFINRINFSVFKAFLVTIKSVNPKLYQDAEENIKLKEEIKTHEIANEVYSILGLIKEFGSNFNSIDFFLNTTYGIKELTKCADNVLEGNDIKTFRATIRPYLDMKIYSQKAINDLLDEKFIFNIDGDLVEVTTEDKIAIISFLEENLIPISNTTFRDACIKFYRKELFEAKRR